MVEFSVVLIGFAIKLVGALLAFVLARLALHNLDKATGFDFKEWIETADDQARAIYMAARIIAICILFGMILA